MKQKINFLLHAAKLYDMLYKHTGNEYYKERRIAQINYIRALIK